MTETTERSSPTTVVRRARAVLGAPTSPVWIATAALFVICAIFVPGSLSSASLLTMIPFASILAIAAVGQTLVVSQRGLDFSVAGMISLSAAIVTKYPNGHGDRIVGALIAVMIVAIIVGVVNGLVITRLGVFPLVATLATSAILEGAATSYSGGFPNQASDNLQTFALGKTLGVPTPAWAALAVVVVTGFVSAKTTIGRRAVAVGANPRAARAAGLRVDITQIATYVIAAVVFAIAGVIVAGYLQTPDLNVGDQYLLSTVTAVVVGGTLLTGGKPRILATAVAAVFLTQLQQVINVLGSPASVENLIEAAAIAAAVGFRIKSSDRAAIVAAVSRVLRRTSTAPASEPRPSE